MAQCASPARMRRKDGECIQVYLLGGALLYCHFFLAVRVCSACRGEGGEIEGLVSIILRARPVGFSEAVHCL